MRTPLNRFAPDSIRCYVAGVFNKRLNGERIEPREAIPDAGERMAKGDPGSGERECQKLGSIVAVGAPESASRNQLIRCELLEMKNVETPKSHKRSVPYAPPQTTPNAPKSYPPPLQKARPVATTGRYLPDSSKRIFPP